MYIKESQNGFNRCSKNMLMKYFLEGLSKKIKKDTIRKRSKNSMEFSMKN